jgi:hypothetical protein
MAKKLWMPATLLLLTSTAILFAADDDWAGRLFPRGTTHDFGNLERGTSQQHRFSMYNLYRVPIEVTEIRTTCSCLNCAPSKKVLQPGESGSIDVTIDTRRFSGSKNFTIYVTVGPKYVSTATLKVAASCK